MQAVRGELTVGTIRYSIFEGRPHISMIEVLEDYRRQGIATQMLRYLQGQYPNEEIVWGYLTEDGSALYQAVVDEQPNPDYLRVQNDLEDITREFDAYVRRLDGGAILSPQEAADMDDLEDTQYRLEKELEELRPIRAFVRMGDGTAGKKEQIYEVAQTHPTGSEFTAFLKKLYGYEGFSGDEMGVKYAMFNSEGVTIEWQDKQGETQETKLSWARAAGVVQRLVDEGRYLETPVVSQTEQQDEVQPFSDQYRLLDRLCADCEYFLGAGQRAEKHLWAGSVDAQIEKMRELYAQLPEKPDWISLDVINAYARRMAAPEPVENTAEASPEETQILDEALDAHHGQIDNLYHCDRDGVYLYIDAVSGQLADAIGKNEG